MRTPRVIQPGSVQHVISRFVDRRWELTSDDERNEYLRRFGLVISASDWLCLAYCLMSNHLHFALVAGESPLDAWALRVNSPFGRWLNARHDRLGPVFADRPSNRAVAPPIVARTIAYIHNNPVRAGVVQGARQSSWSSHRAYLGLAPAPDWLACEEGLRRSGFRSARAFDAFVAHEVASPSVDIDVARVRAELRKRGTVEVGSPTLGETIEYPVVSRPFAVVLPVVDDVVQAAREVLEIPLDHVARRYGRGKETLLKRVVLHAARRLGIATSHASDALNVSRQRGSRIALEPLDDDERSLVERVTRAVRKVDKVYTVPRSSRAR